MGRERRGERIALEVGEEPKKERNKFMEIEVEAKRGVECQRKALEVEEQEKDKCGVRRESLQGRIKTGGEDIYCWRKN